MSTNDSTDDFFKEFGTGQSNTEDDDGFYDPNPADAWTQDLRRNPPTYDASRQSWQPTHAEVDERHDPAPVEIPLPATPEPPSEPKDEKPMWKKFLPGGILVAAILIFALAVLPGVFAGDKDDSSSDTVAVNTGTSSASEQPSKVDTVVGVPETQGVPINIPGGGSPGGHATGTDAIVGYDYAYYSLRKADAAGEFFWKSKPEQADIDSKVKGDLTYSLEVTPLEIGVKYQVLLTLKTPAGQATHRQEIDVEQHDGKFYVANITNLGPVR